MLDDFFIALFATAMPIDETKVACVVDGVSHEARDSLYRDMRANFELEGEPSADSLAAQQAETALGECAERQNWSGDEVSSTFQMAMAVILRDQSASELTRAGVPPEIVSAWFAEQPLESRLDAVANPFDLSTLDARLEARGITAALRQRVDATMGFYIGSLSSIELLRLGRPLPR